MLKRTLTVALACALVSVGCGSSNQFSAGDGSGVSSVENRKPTSSSSQQVSQSASASQPLTKGSFTVWAEPADPVPGRPYELHLEVSVIDPKGDYHCSDLSGTVMGTDRFFMSIQAYCLGGNILVGKRPSTTAGRTTYHYRFSIPGASANVRDTVNVNSRRQNENQILVLSF